MTEGLYMSNTTSQSEQPTSSDIFPACMVTGSQSKKYNINLTDSFLAVEQLPETVRSDVNIKNKSEKGSSLPFLPGSDKINLPASREEFIVTQKQDASLLKCSSSVLTQEGAKEKKVAYVVEDSLLLWRWAGYTWNTGVQFITLLY